VVLVNSEDRASNLHGQGVSGAASLCEVRSLRDLSAQARQGERAMGRSIVIVVLAAFVALLNESYAQESPTDTDMRASYCLAVIQDEWSPLPCAEPGLSGLPKETCDEMANKIARLKAYLVARDFPLAQQDFTAVVVAANRGNADIKDCFATGLTPEYRACTIRCAQQHSDACALACPVPESCQRVRRCNDLGFLPF
jgi:hypothetical protein